MAEKCAFVLERTLSRAIFSVILQRFFQAVIESW